MEDFKKISMYDEDAQVTTSSNTTLKEKFRDAGKEKSQLKTIIPRHFIYVFNQIGNVGAKQCHIIDEQPKDGFETKEEAVIHLRKLILAKEEPYFTRDWYTFTIMETWRSLSAV